jgi:hypothetical protein
LLNIAEAAGFARLLPRLGENWEKDGCKYSDYCYYNKQLN